MDVRNRNNLLERLADDVVCFVGAFAFGLMYRVKRIIGDNYELHCGCPEQMDEVYLRNKK